MTHQAEATSGTLRTRRLVRGVASSAAGKGVGLVAPLMLVSVTYSHLGARRYGLWMTVLSLTSMTLFADLGMGNSLVTVLSGHLARGKQWAATRAVSTAYAILCGQAIVLLAVLVVALWLVPWTQVFNVGGVVPAMQVRAVVAICLTAFVINMPLSLIQRVQYARQEIGQSNAWQAAAGIASLGAAWLAVATGGGYLAVVAAVAFAAPIGNLANSLAWYRGGNAHLRPRLSYVDRSAGGGLLRLGVQFVAISVLGSVALSVDQLVVAHVLGLGDAGHYAVVARMYAVLGLLTTVLCLPLWPANAEALARGDVRWVQVHTMRMAGATGIAVAVVAAGLANIGRPVVALWTRADASYVDPGLLLAFGLSAVLVAVTSPLFMVQNSIGVLRPQLAGWVVFLPLSLWLKAALLHRYGLVGAPVATCVSYGLVMLPAAWWGYRHAVACQPDKPVLRSRSGSSGFPTHLTTKNAAPESVDRANSGPHPMG